MNCSMLRYLLERRFFLYRSQTALVAGVLASIEYRLGGSCNQAVTTMLGSTFLPTELKLRVVSLAVRHTKTQSVREHFVDCHAMKQFLLAFGFKQVLSPNGGVGGVGSSNALCTRLRMKLADEHVRTELSLKLTNVRVFEI